VPLILALDQGTTSSRAIVFDEEGRALGSAQAELTQHFPRSGWVEHDPMEILEGQLATARDALKAAGVTARDLAGIGITNQRETTLVWDRRTGEPVHRALVWQDRRTAPFCEKLRADGLTELLQSRTGLLPDPYFSGSKLRWILDEVEGVRRRAEAGELAFGTVDSWLLWHLTGGRVHATDASNASRTLLMNLETGDWDEELLEIFGVPRELLPELRDSSGVFGETEAELLGGSVPVAGVAGDQQAALFGQAAFDPGLAKNTYGTGCFLLVHVGDRPVASRHRLLSTVAWRIGGRTEYALEGSVFIGGAVVQWLRDGLGIVEGSDQIEALARQVPDNGGIFLVPAFAGLGAPHWDPHARGAIMGISRGTTAAHLARAALEGIAFQVADILEVMAEDAGAPLEELRVDGGAAANDLLMQFQADILGVPLVRPRVTETTALGAAFLAGLATGVWSSRDELRAVGEVDARFEPSMAADEVAHHRAGWRNALSRVGDWDREFSGDGTEAPGPGKPAGEGGPR
jgi:glycerol kinase